MRLRLGFSGYGLFKSQLFAFELGKANLIGHGAVDLVIDRVLQSVMFFDESIEMRRIVHRMLLLSGTEHVSRHGLFSTAAPGRAESQLSIAPAFCQPQRKIFHQTG